jgi:cytochrome c-type biogenesis protein CcmF
MTSIIGHALMIFSATFALGQFFCPARKVKALASLSVLTFSFVCLTFFWLVWAYVNSDFSIVNVALNSHTQKPLLYKIVGVWGNHEGSMLLWTFLTAVVGLIAAFQARSWGIEVYSFTLKQMGLIIFALIAFVGTTSDPFWPMDSVPVQGMGLNPLLQDPLLATHPPILYLGYGLMALLFSLSLAVVRSAETNKSALFRMLYPWASLAWAFSTFSLLLGSYWAYYQLGWGGWWFWDPVENASLLPWLSVAASVHILRSLKYESDEVLLPFVTAVAVFSFALLSTFFVRSGMLSSVHSFADDGGRGLFLIGFLILLLWQSGKAFRCLKKSPFKRASISFLSRQGLIYTAVALSGVLLGITLLGIIYPLILEKGFGEKITVGEPYFLKTFVPIAWGGLFLAGLSLIVPVYKGFAIKKYIPVIVGAAILSGIGGYILFAERKMILNSLPWGLWISLCLLLMTFYGFYRLVKIQRWKILKTPSLAGAFGHLGLAICCVGMAMDRGLGEEQDIALSEGQSFYLKGLKISMEPVERGVQENYFYERVPFSIRYRGKVFSSFYAEKRFFKAHQVLTTKVGRWRDGASEVYIVPGPPIGEVAERTFRVQYRPWVYLIWWGGFLIVGALCFSASIAFRDKTFKRVCDGDQGISNVSLAA